MDVVTFKTAEEAQKWAFDNTRWDVNKFYSELVANGFTRRGNKIFIIDKDNFLGLQ